MSPAKKQDVSPPVAAWLRGLFSWLLGSGRPLLIVAVLAGVFGGGWYSAWRKVGPRVLSLPEYRVGPEQVEIITPPPAWIHSDVRGEAFRDPILARPLSILDDDLIARIKKAFENCPWVAKVNGVSKSHPAWVKVELAYRQPVCMVEVRGGLWAVDAEGVLLPGGDFSPLEASRYPRLTGVDREPQVAPGQRWGDAKVVGGAEIAAALVPVWDKMKLQRIVPLTADPVPTAVGANSGRLYIEPFFVLFTRGDALRGGTRILWGYAPGANAVGELPPAEKLARLQRYLDEHDALDGPQGQRQELDVRKLPSPVRP